MNWTEIKITTESAGVDHVCAALLALGVEGAVIEDPKALADFLENPPAHWDYVDELLLPTGGGAAAVKIYLPDTPAGAETLALVKESLERLKTLLPSDVLGPLTVETALCSEEDWENNWKQYYDNIQIGDRLVISPLWKEAPPCGPGTAVVKMDPGMAFGTGAHETTRLCLQLLCRCLGGGEEVLDLGCGSGILGISALKLGAKSVRAVDIDPLAAQISMDNAALNGFHFPAFLSGCGNVLTDPTLRTSLLGRKYDLAMANIVADVILPLFPLVKPALHKKGRYLVSGIIAGRTGEVERAAAACGFQIKEKLCENDWVSYLFSF